MGCHSLFQGVFPTQGSNLGLPHRGQILYDLSQQGSPTMTKLRPLLWASSVHKDFYVAVLFCLHTNPRSMRIISILWLGKLKRKEMK